MLHETIANDRETANAAITANRKADLRSEVLAEDKRTEGSSSDYRINQSVIRSRLITSALHEDESKRGRALSGGEFLELVASTQLGDGFTVSPNWIKGKEGREGGRLDLVRDVGIGYAVSVGGHTEHLLELDENGDLTEKGTEFLLSWLDLMERGREKLQVWFGGYKNPPDTDTEGSFEVNLSLVFNDAAEAERFGASTGQDTIYDLEAQDVIEVRYED